MSRRLLLLLAACGVLGACVTVPRTPKLHADVPPDWHPVANQPGVVFSRDGVDLQLIRLETLTMPVTYGHTKRTVTEHMSALDATAVVLGEVASDGAKTGVELYENRPALVAGLPGFRLVFGYRNLSGLRYRSVYYGALRGATYYSLQYVAPVRYYFDRDLATFDAAAASARLEVREGR